MRHVRWNHQHFSRVHDDFALAMLTEQDAQPAGQNVCDLLIMMRMSRDVVAFLQEDLRDHHALGGNQLPSDAALEGFLRHVGPTVMLQARTLDHCLSSRSPDQITPRRS